jgi:ADP-ribose pyrophosphatase YjhB (NUDIX family)
MKSRHKVTQAVFIAVFDKESRILLQRRYNTGYMDGFYDFPSGHVEANESLKDSAVRELKEETSLLVSPDFLQLLHINQNNSDEQNPYINFVFLAQEYEGNPYICEPHKCDDLGFFALNSLPQTTFPVQVSLGAIKAKISLSFSLSSYTASLL